MKFAPNKFYNNNSFANWNLDSIFLHIFYMIFTKLRILKLLSKAPKFITSRRERKVIYNRVPIPIPVSISPRLLAI